MTDTENSEPTVDEPESDAQNTPEEPPSEVGADKVQSPLDEEQEKGYRGTATDETPNQAYTVAGVTSGQETPESKASKGE